MQLLLVSDLHYRLPQFDWLMAAANDVDVVVIAGDLLDIRSAVPIDAQITAVSAQLRALSKGRTLLTASGNHDLDGRDANGEKAARWLPQARADGIYVDGDTFAIGDTVFTVCAWWDGPVGRAKLERQLAETAIQPKQRWVWVHHAPPKRSPLAWDGRKEYGDEAVAEWIERWHPDIVLTGHIHQAPFVDGGGWAQRIGDTWLFNAGQQPGPVPTYVVIDLDAGNAVWTCATERQETSLRIPA